MFEISIEIKKIICYNRIRMWLHECTARTKCKDLQILSLQALLDKAERLL